jgi:hypothetical protein
MLELCLRGWVIQVSIFLPLCKKKTPRRRIMSAEQFSALWAWGEYRLRPSATSKAGYECIYEHNQGPYSCDREEEDSEAKNRVDAARSWHSAIKAHWLILRKPERHPSAEDHCGYEPVLDWCPS